MTLELLIAQIQDPYIRENLRRIKLEMEKVQGQVVTINNAISSSGGGTPAVPSEVWTAATSTIPAGSTLAIDSVLLTQFRAIKYIVTVYNEANLTNRSFEMKVVNKFGSVDDQVYASIGSSIVFSIESLIVGPDMNLNLTNNTGYELTAKFARLIL